MFLSVQAITFEPLDIETSLPPANKVWGKVIFLHLSVILFTGWGVSGQVPPPAGTPQAGTPQAGHTCQVHPPGKYTFRQVHPLGRYTPQAGIPPRQYTPSRYTPLGRFTPQAGTPPSRYTPTQSRSRSRSY